METRETIRLDSKAQQRLYVLSHVLAGEMTVAQAAAGLRLSVRQVDRLVSRRAAPIVVVASYAVAAQLLAA